MILRGERTFGSKENFSLMFSKTDGATYVKPWREDRTRAEDEEGQLGKGRQTMVTEEEELTRKAWLALSLRVESSGLSTGVWLVNLESN